MVSKWYNTNTTMQALLLLSLSPVHLWSVSQQQVTIWPNVENRLMMFQLPLQILQQRQQQQQQYWSPAAGYEALYSDPYSGYSSTAGTVAFASLRHATEQA